ncbi:MAG: glycoside hydrolase family 78 protein [Alicyclobacillus sp.]|nr:glycoside hydrolase family 78 protein [Alicyclobacillus sp.]
MGIDVLNPRISWQLTGSGRDVRQSAYQIQVSLDPAFSTLIWDTGQVNNQKSIHIPYEGQPLQSRTRYHVRVRVWDWKGDVSGWSETAYWETGLLHSNEWIAEWISGNGVLEAEPAHYLRRMVRLDGAIASARAYVSARGLYELYLNGRRVGDWVLTPGWTSYHHQLQYQTYDVTDHLLAGENAIGIVLGNGWYSGEVGWNDGKGHYGDARSAILQLHVVYQDGREQVVVTDGAWRASTGPILMSEIYHGETYDARLEVPTWCTAGYDDSAWSPVSVLNESKDVLVAQINLPTRVVEEIQPVAVFQTPAGETVIDMGQNMVGWVKFRVRADRGTKITLKHAEVLDKDGNFYTANLRSARQTITYICRGDGEDEFEPHFTFQGFRYVKVEGYPGEPSLADFVGRVVSTDLDWTGSFECSNPMINQLQHNIVWGQKGNFVDVPTDCPQRDERLGWTGDAQVFIRTAAFNANVAPFFTKWLRDLQFDQFGDGGIPHVIPNVLGREGSSAAWGDAAVICPWTIYQCYGDVRVLAAQYDSMKAWVEYIRRQGDNEFLWNTGFHYGDWLGLDAHEGSYVGATPRDLIATAFYAYSTSILTKAAQVLGKADDVETYQNLHRNIVHHFRREFVTPNGRLLSETQTAHVLALMFDLVDGVERKRVADSLAKIIVDNGYKLTTGFVGTPYLCHVLTETGHHDVACRLVTQTEYPSWLYAITKGATTIWEHWDGIKPDGSFWSADMNSFNHYAYGSIGDWLYRKLAGLDCDAESAGYQRIVIHPHPDASFTYAKARYESMMGVIRSEWRYDAETDKMMVLAEIPGNAEATIFLPGATAGGVLESGKPLADAEGLRIAAGDEDALVIRVGSGVYQFEYPYSLATACPP